jgi:hypothetical protein
MKKQNRKSKQHQLFDPDRISTSIHQAIRRDFAQAQQLYSLNDSSILYSFNRQVNELLKKYCSTTQDVPTLETETFEKFLKVNSHMLDTNLKLFYKLPWNESRIKKDTKWIDKVHLRARALTKSVLGSFSALELFEECKHSSGSSIGVPFMDTSIERKFKLPMSVTDRVEPLLTKYFAFDTELKAAVIEHNCDNPVTDWYQVVDGSRATTVDKTTDKRRMICVEPTGNMFFQQGLMQMMYKRLKSVGLDVEFLPEQHKDVARLSSISCKSATVDWSSASDCVSIELLRWLLPSDWFDIVYYLRCDTTSLNGAPINLQMISTMGNAVTFPLETLVFWTYANAVLFTEETNICSTYPPMDRLLSGTYVPEKYISVFGDDCIVPSAIATQFIETMTEVGFIINDDKSFYGSMQFRESCGGDYLAGYDVRPFYLKAPPGTKRSHLEPWLYIILNSLLKKYITYFGELSYVYDKHALRQIFSIFRRYGLRVKLVPPYFPDDAGLKVTDPRLKRHYRMMLSPIAKSNHGTYSFQYCRFVYFTRKDRYDHLHYSIWLKKPSSNDDIDPRKFFFIRKKGGYVVSKGISAHWTLPQFNAAPQ